MSHGCAPHRYDKKNNTCFSTNQLIEMAKAYNRYLTKNKLSPSNVVKSGNTNVDNFNLIKIENDKKYLLKEFKIRFDKVCGNNEACITKQSFMNELVAEMKNDFLSNTFRTEGPVSSTEWLSTIEINNIMKQYENIYSTFKFLGAVPLNCDEYSFCTLHKLNYNKCTKKNKLGIIFNLDRVGQPGSHWVALYISVAEGKIYFCDSNGKPPIDNITKIINQFIKFYQNKTNKTPIYKYNTKSYQKDNSECGVYSCNFLIRILAEESFEDIVDNYLSFNQINSCRNVYFNNGKSKYQVHAKCDPTVSI